MQKEDILTVAHLFSAMKDGISRLEDALKKKDNEQILGAKKEILDLQKQIRRFL